MTSLQLVDDQEKMSVNDFLNRKKMKQKGKEKEKEKDIEWLKERELLTEKILMVLLSRPFFSEKRCIFPLKCPVTKQSGLFIK